MTVLVIGGAGYVGRPLVRLLRERVETVSASREVVDGVDEQVDMRRPAEVTRLLSRVRPDVIVLTAYMLQRAVDAAPARAVETNVLGVTNVFQAAADLGVRRVVFASSGAVHGSGEDFESTALDETVPCRPTTLYGTMKVFNESMAEHYNRHLGTEIVSYRISGPYGHAKPYERFGGEIPYDTVVSAAIEQHKIVLPWSADARFRFIHVEDAAASFVPLVLADSLRHRVYNAPGFTVSIRDLAATAQSETGLVCEFTEPGRPVKFVRWDTTRYDDEFAFRPRLMADWMRQEIRQIKETAMTSGDDKRVPTS